MSAGSRTNRETFAKRTRAALEVVDFRITVPYHPEADPIGASAVRIVAGEPGMSRIFETNRNLRRWLANGAGLRPIGVPMATVPGRSLPALWGT